MPGRYLPGCLVVCLIGRKKRRSKKTRQSRKSERLHSFDWPFSNQISDWIGKGGRTRRVLWQPTYLGSHGSNQRVNQRLNEPSTKEPSSCKRKKRQLRTPIKKANVHPRPVPSPNGEVGWAGCRRYGRRVGRHTTRHAATAATEQGQVELVWWWCRGRKSKEHACVESEREE